MRAGNAGPRGRRLTAGVILAACVAAILAPAPADALDSDLKGFAVFRLDGSNGYTILGFASSERIDGRGDLGLIVYRKDDAAVYGTRAIVTPTRLEADLGGLGKFSADIVRSGKWRTLRSRCDGESLTFEPRSYRGTFEFHGERGYTEAVATRVPEYARFQLEFLCSDGGRGGFGPGSSGAWLRARVGEGHHRLQLEARKERSGARPRVTAEISEKHDGITIQREVSRWAGVGAFDYDPLLRTATLKPPAPFSGRAVFNRTAEPSNRWRGSLAVDFPGRPDVSLTGAGLRTSLVPALRAAGFEVAQNFPCSSRL